MNTLDRMKENAIAFYDLMFNKCRPREAIERYAGAQYIQHNPEHVTLRILSELVALQPQ